MLVIGYNEGPITATRDGTSGRGLIVLSVVFEDTDRAEFGPGIEWLPHGRPAVVSASICGCEPTTALACTLG